RPSGGGQQLWEMRLLATRRHGPFLSWLISDNDRLLEESDFVAVTVPGFVRGLINKTSLALMKPHAVLIPISANPVDFDALYQVLLTRSIGAVLDVWPQGCWHFPDMFCGPPYAEEVSRTHPRQAGSCFAAQTCWQKVQLGTAGRSEAQPFWANLATLENVVVLPGVAMRDEIFWSNSAHFVAANLVALVDGRPLRGVVCNASDPWPTV
ncbi:unnamed protein product, partial [Durusdinium trenchii]